MPPSGSATRKATGQGMTSRRDKGIKALVAGCRKGDQSDWAELVDRLTPVIFAICYRYRLSREERFDVFGKVLLLLLEHLPQLREEERIFGYVSTITNREAALVRSKSKVFGERLSEQSLYHLSADFSATAVPALDLEEDLNIMARSYAALSRKCRELLHLLFMEPDPVSYREVSLRLGIPVPSIGPTRSRCLEKLRRKMKENGYEE